VLSTDDRILGLLLGLGDLAPRDICHGYRHACVCHECKDRAAGEPARTPAAQPWEPKPTKAT